MSRPTAMIFDAYEAVDVVDAGGRVLTLRPPHALDRLRLFKAVGPELAQNPLYLGMALLACAVTAIDGVPVPPPTNEHQIEQIIGRLGDVGLRAASEVVDRTPTDMEVREEAGN